MKKSEPKAIAKRMKYGHLQKLKWYCEICRHQCNDEQSYRQHVQSEKHRLMMAHFRANSGSILKSNSRAFESSFIDVLKRRFVGREVPANVVYTQVIRDKNHVHMNATFWESVHGFCCHLERAGKIEMRMTERGPLIKYIDHEADMEAEIQRENERLRIAETIREREKADASVRMAAKPARDDVRVEKQTVSAVIAKEKRGVERKVAAMFT